MKIIKPYYKMALPITLSVFMVAGILGASAASAVAATSPTLDLKVLLVGDGASDPTTAAWVSALASEGVPYTEVDATGATATAGTTTATGSWTVTLPALSSGTTGFFNGVVIADDPADYAAGQLSALDTYESTFGVDQVDGFVFPTPSLGQTDVTSSALDGTTGALTTAGLATFPALAGPVPFATGTFGYGATANSGAPYTPLVTNSAGDALAGIYHHPSTDAQAGVSELALNFNYNASQLQWLLLAPGLINWVTQGTHLGEYRNYVEMDIDDTFTPDDAWDPTTHEIDYNETDSLRMNPEDVITSAQWSQANAFRLDQLFNYGSTVAYQQGNLPFNGADNAAGGPDPLLAQFQATDPATGKPYADDYGWISHTYDTPYLDVGCATQNYIEAELNENSSTLAAAPGATPGTGGLGITNSTDDSLTYGAEDPQVYVPGNHSGFANLVPGNPATVDQPDLNNETPLTATAGTLTPGTYEYAVTDQFTGAPVSASAGESAAYVTAPVTVTSAENEVDLQWQAICHAANYNIYREEISPTPSAWTLVGNYYTPASATLPDNSAGDPASTTDVTNGGESQLTFTDSGSAAAQCQGDAGYCVSSGPAPWTTPPITENAVESPWEQNPYFIPAMEAVGITAVGDDASKPYPNPPTDEFGIGASYTGATYAAGQTYLEGTAQVVPRHPINVYYNASTEAQELDEYNTLYPSATPATYASVVNSVVAQMLDYMLTNNPEPSYVHQTNLMGILPGCTTSASGAAGTVWPNCDPAATTGTPPATPEATGDGTLYSVLDPLLAEYHSYYNDNATNTGTTPFVQLTEGQIATVLANQAAWGATLTSTSSGVSASEKDGVVTITNTGTSAAQVPVSMPTGTTAAGAPFGQAYGGGLSEWANLAGGASLTLAESVAPAITSAATATSNVGAAFTFTVTATGEPAPALSETGALPAGLSFVDNGNGTATISGTPAAGSGGSYPLTITAANATGTVAQSFTLSNSQAPTITSPATATFTTTVAGSYDITTTGFPAAVLSDGTSVLPAGLSFTDNHNGSGSIAGTPAAGSEGTYPVTVTATNTADNSAVTLDLVITVHPATAPTISVGSADFSVGQMGAVGVTTTGYPTPTVTETGALPAGLSFVDNGNGTALLSGAPTTTGSTTLTLKASNGISPDATTTLTVIVGQGPAITSAGTTSATTGLPYSFTVTTSGYPAPSIAAAGLPAGLSFVDNGNGTGTISGTPAATATGAYTVNLTTTNLGGSTGQALAMTVDKPAPGAPSGSGGASASTGATSTGGAGTGLPGATSSTSGPSSSISVVSTKHPPVFTSSSTVTGTSGHKFSFQVAVSGDPIPSLRHSTLPGGLRWTSFDGGAAIVGVPTITGPTKVLLTASNAEGSAEQLLTISVERPAAFVTGKPPVAAAGHRYSFTVTAFGYPTPSIAENGALPAGLVFTSRGKGEATLTGVPTMTSTGAHPITLTVSNRLGTTTAHYVLLVGQAPAITSAANVKAVGGEAFTFTLTATGYPAPEFVHTTLPSGLKWADAGNGTAIISGTPGAMVRGTRDVVVKAKNAFGTVTQTLKISLS
jgi:hypothetical protein